MKANTNEREDRNTEVQGSGARQPGVDGDQSPSTEVAPTENSVANLLLLISVGIKHPIRPAK